MARQRADHLSAPKLRSSVRMDHAAGDVAAHRDGVLDRLDGQVRLHPRVDRVPHDPAREHVLDRAEVELAFRGLVLGDVGQPQLVRCIRSEHMTGSAVLVDDGTPVVVHRRPRLAVLAVFGFAAHTEPAVVRGDLPRDPLRHRFTVAAGLVSQEPVPELRVVAVRVEQGVRAIRLHHLAVGDGMVPRHRPRPRLGQRHDQRLQHRPSPQRARGPHPGQRPRRHLDRSPPPPPDHHGTESSPRTPNATPTATP